MLKITYASCIIMLLISCSKNVKTDSSYVDAQSFFAAEIQKLNDQKMQLQKTLQFDDSIATSFIERVNWKQEIKSFEVIDLRKPSLKGAFKIDTNITSVNKVIRYTAIDDKIELKLVEITLENNTNKIKKVKALINKKNNLYKAYKELTYYSDSAFTLKGQQEILLGKNTRYTISGNFIAP